MNRRLALTIRIRPQQIAHRPVVRHFLLPVYRPDLVNGAQVWTQAAVHAEDAPVDHGREREVVEDLAAPAPHVRGAVLALAFVVEAVYLEESMCKYVGERR